MAAVSVRSPGKPRFLDQIRQAIRVRHYSLRTEEAYVQWVRRFILFHNKRHPKNMGETEINSYMTHLAVNRKVAASTQTQALCALVFMYRHVLNRDLGDFGHNLIRAKKKKRLPVVFSPKEAQTVLSNLSGKRWLMASLLYGSGLRLSECVRLRIKDVDFSYNQVIVRSGKGEKDRITLLPARLQPDLKKHLKSVQRLHREDLKRGFGTVYLPYALSRKYPNADKSWEWQYIFPSDRLSVDPRSGVKRRHHVEPQGLQRAVKAAIRKAGIVKAASCHTFRHSFATHLLENGYDIRTIQALMGHKDVSTTMVYTHVLNQGVLGVKSPLDSIEPDEKED